MIGKQEPPLWDVDCLYCALDRVVDTTHMLNVGREKRIELMHKALRMLADGDINRPNFFQIDEVRRMVEHELGVEDPYHDLRLYYNAELMKQLPDMRAAVAGSSDPLCAAIRYAIAGNQIDLSTHGVDTSMEAVHKRLLELGGRPIDADDTASLKAALAKAKTVLVLGDNCGEIVMDRLLLETLARLYPQAELTYAVRGEPTVNDVLYEDAHQVGIDTVAKVIDNGVGILSTPLTVTSESFDRAFMNADVVLSKGMGNYESLCRCEKKNLWFLMIAKCNVISNLTGVPKGGVLCLEIGHERKS